MVTFHGCSNSGAGQKFYGKTRTIHYQKFSWYRLYVYKCDCIIGFGVNKNSLVAYWITNELSSTGSIYYCTYYIIKSNDDLLFEM